MSIKRKYRKAKRGFKRMFLAIFLLLLFSGLFGFVAKITYQPTIYISSIHELSRERSSNFTGKVFLVETNKGLTTFEASDEDIEGRLKDLLDMNDTEIRKSPYKIKVIRAYRTYRNEEREEDNRIKANLLGLNGNKIIFSSYFKLPDKEDEKLFFILNSVFIVLSLLCALGVILCIREIFKRRRISRKAEEFLLSEFHSIESLGDLDEISEYIDKKIGVAVNKGYLIIFAEAIYYYKLEDIIWLYMENPIMVGTMVGNIFDFWYVVIGDKKKLRRIRVKTSFFFGKNLYKNFQNLHDFLKDNYPEKISEIMIGFNYDSKKEYNRRKKENK